jgi:hypothetical protein
MTSTSIKEFSPKWLKFPPSVLETRSQDLPPT